MKIEESSVPIRVGIISDTHGVLREDVKEVLRTCSHIIHAGDMDRSFIVSELTPIGKLYAVRGNCDGEWASSYLDTYPFSIGGVKFFLIHNRKKVPYPRPKVDVIVFGHSHKYFYEEKDGILWLNPGSCGRRRFYGDLTMAVMTIQNGSYEVEKITLDSEEENSRKLSKENQLSIAMIQKILVSMQKGKQINQIAEELSLRAEVVENVCRIAVTHPGVSAEGIYNKMEVNRINE